MLPDPRFPDPSDRAPTTERPVLFAANHISYIDITVLGSLIPGSFVAKAEVARWPFFGWLAKLQRSVFVDRRVRSTAFQRDAMGERLAAGDALILFPEGTSGDGNRVLPFKSALFARRAAREGFRSGGRATGFAGLYAPRRDADRAPCRPLFAWYGTCRMAPHMWSMLGLGTVEVIVEFHPPATCAECGSRKALAGYCQERVAARARRCAVGRPRDGRAGTAAGPSPSRRVSAPHLASTAPDDAKGNPAHPGRQMRMTEGVFIKTYGCQMNVYDSGRMADLLAPLGYPTPMPLEDADLVILNTCHIREKAAEKVYSELGTIRA